MPLTRVSIRRGKPEAYRKAILRNVYEAMHDVFNVPEDDYFMVLSEHEAADFVFPSRFLDIEHSENLVLIQITCNNTRALPQKQALYKRIVERLEKEPGIAPNDVLINLVEVTKENWSLGNGLATFA
jgi:phenylpyruvate tautomerase PptA (4-oxalocrotonate tautomerase family)